MRVISCGLLLLTLFLGGRGGGTARSSCANKERPADPSRFQVQSAQILLSTRGRKNRGGGEQHLLVEGQKLPEKRVG